jgi:hypothetical protein
MKLSMQFVSSAEVNVEWLHMPLWCAQQQLHVLPIGGKIGLMVG